MKITLHCALFVSVILTCQLAASEVRQNLPLVKCELFSYSVPKAIAENELKNLREKKESALEDFKAKNFPPTNESKPATIQEAIERAKRPEFKKYIADRTRVSDSFDQQIIALVRQKSSPESSGKFLEFTTKLGETESVVGITPEGQKGLSVTTSVLESGEISGSYSPLSTGSGGEAKNRSNTFIARLDVPALGAITSTKVTSVGNVEIDSPTFVAVTQCKSVS